MEFLPEELLAEASLASAKQEQKIAKLLYKPTANRAPVGYEGISSKHRVLLGTNSIATRSNANMLKAGFIAAGGTT